MKARCNGIVTTSILLELEDGGVKDKDFCFRDILLLLVQLFVDMVASGRSPNNLMISYHNFWHLCICCALGLATESVLHLAS